MSLDAPTYADNPTFEKAVELFNRGEFFDTHEKWEELWTPKSAPDRRFLQALIHFAVACHHHQRGNAVGFERQREKGLLKIAAYSLQHEGLDLERLIRQMACVDQGYPQIERV